MESYAITLFHNAVKGRFIISAEGVEDIKAITEVRHSGREEMKFITSRQALWDRLSELARIRVKSEEERLEEEYKSREFWALGRLDERLRYGPVIGFSTEGMTELQRRIMYAARFQEPDCESLWRSNYIRDGQDRYSLQLRGTDLAL